MRTFQPAVFGFHTTEISWKSGFLGTTTAPEGHAYSIALTRMSVA